MLSLKNPKKSKFNLFPADCVIHHNSQQLARFKAGAMSSSPAKTGKDNNNNTAVTIIAHPNKANLCNLIPGLLIFKIVVMTQIKGHLDVL